MSLGHFWVESGIRLSAKYEMCWGQHSLVLAFRLDCSGDFTPQDSLILIGLGSSWLILWPSWYLAWAFFLLSGKKEVFSALCVKMAPNALESHVGKEVGVPSRVKAVMISPFSVISCANLASCTVIHCQVLSQEVHLETWSISTTTKNGWDLGPCAESLALAQWRAFSILTFSTQRFFAEWPAWFCSDWVMEQLCFQFLCGGCLS